MIWTLQRTQKSSIATLGTMISPAGSPFCVTLERPDLGNQHDISCIPAGTYTAHRFKSPKRGYDVFKLLNVPDRTDIEIHIGNFESNTDGCILLGRVASGPAMIDDSKAAFDAFMAANEGVVEFTLVVKDPS